MTGFRRIKYIKSFIDGVEKDYDKVWEILASIRKKQENEHEAVTRFMIEFQVELAKILFRLEKEFQFNAKVHNQLKRNRRSYRSYKDFKRLETECIEIKRTLDAMIYFGRSLGDAFAWLFYNKEPDILRKHAEVQESRMAVTTGGWCELEFIKNHPVINNQLVIYHNITNILRLGDISMWGGSKARLTGIGEIKSQKKNNGEVLINVEVLGHKNMLVPFPESSLPKETKTTINYANKERRDRQIKRIADTFKDHDVASDRLINHFDFLPYYNKISAAIKETQDGFKMTQIDRGLALVSFRPKERSFAERLLAKDLPKEEFDQIKLEHIKEIFTAPKYNTMLFRSVHFKKDMQTNVVPGLRPLFWSDIDIDVIKQIYYGEIYLFTVYNPGHLICEMEDYGFILSDDKQELIKAMDGKHYRIEGLSFFFSMIAENLHPEACIADIILKTLEAVEKKNFDKPTRAMMNFHFES